MVHSPTLLLLSSLLAATASAKGLHDLAVAAGLEFFGTATETGMLDDVAYQLVLSSPGEFGLLVPENSQKWESIQPSSGDFQFDDPDTLVQLANSNRQLFRCHTLTWHSQLPSFVEDGVWTRETLTAVIQTHIANVVGHFKGQCHSWDVVNEAIEDDGTFRQSVFFTTLGTDFLPISFEAAAAADPEARLWYNDFSLEFNSPKTDAAVHIVELVQAAGAPIHGVGFQAHMIVGGTPSQETLTTVLRKFTALGMEVAFTELDVRHETLPADATAIEQQAADYVTIVRTCLDVAECVGVVVWQFTDKYSWIPAAFEGEGDACLYDENMVPKPAHTSVSSLLASYASATAGVSSSAAAATSVTAAVIEKTVTVTVTATPTDLCKIVPPTLQPLATPQPADTSLQPLQSLQPLDATPVQSSSVAVPDPNFNFPVVPAPPVGPQNQVAGGPESAAVSSSPESSGATRRLRPHSLFRFFVW